MTLRKSTTLHLAAAAAAMVLLSSCGSPGDPDPGAPTTDESSTAPTATTTLPTSTTPGSPAATDSTAASAPAGAPDTSDWNEFSTQGLSFKYPSTWRVEADDCDDCTNTAAPHDDPFTKWEVKNEQGETLIEFRADSALDTDGDMASYERTEIEREKLPASMPQEVSLYAEHFTSTESDDSRPQGEKESEFIVMLINDELIAERGQQPALAYFTPKKDFSAIMESTSELPELLGYRDDDVSVEDARKIVQSPEYQTVKAIMLSFEGRAG